MFIKYEMYYYFQWLIIYFFQNLPFEVIASKFEENLKLSDFDSPAEFVVETAKRKALEVAEDLDKEGVFISNIIIFLFHILKIKFADLFLCSLDF